MQEKYGESARAKYVFQKVYWPPVVIIYFAWSFMLGGWGISWMVFVVAGIFYSVLETVFVKR
jgi:hypothetical protein